MEASLAQGDTNSAQQPVLNGFSRQLSDPALSCRAGPAFVTRVNAFDHRSALSLEGQLGAQQTSRFLVPFSRFGGPFGVALKGKGMPWLGGILLESLYRELVFPCVASFWVCFIGKTQGRVIV